jgi:hypothetical protein
VIGIQAEKIQRCPPRDNQLTYDGHDLPHRSIDRIDMGLMGVLNTGDIKYCDGNRFDLLELIAKIGNYIGER